MKTYLYLFTDSYPYGYGESFLETEIKYLSEQFDAIKIIPLEDDKKKSMRSIPENAEVMPSLLSSYKNRKEIFIKGLFNLSPVWRYLKELCYGKVYSSLKRIWLWGTFVLLTRAGLAYLRSKNILTDISKSAICYFYWGLRWSQVLPFMNKLNARVIVRFHGSDVYENVNYNYIPMRASQLANIDKAVFVSQCGNDYLTGRYSQIRQKAYVSRLGTLDQGLNPYKKAQIITLVSCSNLVRVKRVTLIAACLQCFDLKLKWIHIGDGPEMNKIKTLVKSLPSNVEADLSGSVSHHDLMKFYQSTSVDAFINVSSSEGIPVSIMEALSFGIPVIATDVGGVSEITDNETGVLVPSDIAPETLALELKGLINRNDYDGIRIKARRRWEERCNADKIYPDFIKLMKED